jgi:trigger factor
MILDEIVEAEKFQPSENDILEYLAYSAQQYNMDLNEFIKIMDQNNQIPSVVAEVARRKVLGVVLSRATVVDKKGKAIDLTGVLAAPAADSHEGHDHD